MRKIGVIFGLVLIGLLLFGCTTKDVQKQTTGDLFVQVGTEFRMPDGTIIAEDGGKVTSLPEGIDCPGDCTETYLLDERVTLIAAVKAGWKFIGWSGACIDAKGNMCNITKSKALRVEGDKYPATAYALFEKNITKEEKRVDVDLQTLLIDNESFPLVAIFVD